MRGGQEEVRCAAAQTIFQLAARGDMEVSQTQVHVDGSLCGELNVQSIINVMSFFHSPLRMILY